MRQKSINWTSGIISYALRRATGVRVDTRPELGTVEITDEGGRGFSDTIYVPIADIDKLIAELQQAKKYADESGIVCTGKW